MKIKKSDGCTKAFDITKGVLQGELLGPVFVPLFIADIEECFVNKVATGLHIDSISRFLMLLYVDDLNILSKMGFTRKIRIFEEFVDQKLASTN